MNVYITRFAILLISLILTQTAFADVKIKLRQTSSGQTMENTTYIKGKRERAEQGAGEAQMITITECDLKRTLQIMPQAQAYTVSLWNAPAAPTEKTVTTNQKVETVKGGVVTTTMTVKDTGERKQMFGYTARHLIITMESTPSPDACNTNKSKMQFDGWYIDATFALQCQEEQMKSYNPNSYKNGGCQDRYEMKQIGTAKRGYPLYEKMIMFDESGKESFTTVNEVVELSNTTLDAALFDVPAGYREMKDASEMYSSMSSQSRTSSSTPVGKGNVGTSQTIKNMANPTSTTNAPVGEKKAGVIRIGLAQIKTGAVGEGLNAQELAAAIQNTMLEYLKSPKVEVVPLEAKLLSAVGDEARSKECDFVIYATVSHKKGGSGFGGMFGKTLGSVVGQTGIGQTGSVAGNIAGQMATTAIVSATSASVNVKSKDEITLDVKVNSAGGGAQAMAKQYKQKAKGDGDDIITPIIEQAAPAILDAVTK